MSTLLRMLTSPFYWFGFFGAHGLFNHNWFTLGLSLACGLVGAALLLRERWQEMQQRMDHSLGQR